jgi:phage tail sheath protein FI
MPPDAVLAGLLAGHTLTRGSFLSAAGAAVAATRLAEALPDPEGRTARFEAGAAGTVLAADHTPSPDPVARHAAVRRLTALLLRSAARLGADAVFEPSNERLWRDIEIRLGLLLERILAAGGLRGEARDAFFARCGRSTMTPADIDNGRLIAEVGFAPALPVERVRVRMALDGGVAVGAAP